MFESSVLEISRSALEANLRFLRQRVGRDVRFCSVVKGNAYGHGIAEFTELAMNNGIDFFGVYSAAEAYELVRNTNRKPAIYIMGMVEDEAVDWAVHQEIEMCVFDMARLEKIDQQAKKNSLKAKVHLEIETGMNRTGFAEKELTQLSNWLRRRKESIEVVGACTHFSGAECLANDFRIRTQIARYQSAVNTLKEHGIEPRYTHSACSAAVMNYPETISNMVRVGIMQYGYWPNDETFIRFNGNREKNSRVLKRLIRWKSKVMNVKPVRKGEFIGYGTTYLAYRDMTVAIVPVGYAHGYARSLSNAGKVLIRGMEAPVAGNVNMNLISVDVTHIPGVEKGDEVVLIGKQKNKAVSVVSFSELSHQLNYELLTRLPDDIPRIFVD